MAEWNFDEGQGNVLRDTSGNDNDGKIHGASWAKCGDGFALVFDGVDDYVEFGERPSLNVTGPVTVEAWVKPMSAGWKGGGFMGTSIEGYLFAYRAGVLHTAADPGVCEWHIGRRGVLRVQLRIRQWNHVVGTFDDDPDFYFVSKRWLMLA